ncbi:hypothetical protein ACM66B_006596 [Microbotryomycetes sp. NB124-2]
MALGVLTLALLATVATATTADRRTADDDFRAYVPYDALVKVTRNPTSNFSTHAASAPRPHMAHRRGLRAGHDGSHIRKRQVTNPRQAAWHWDHRSERPAKRAQTSAVACSGQAGNYGQCGGTGFNNGNPMCCATGWTCTYSNDYYSQCLPSTTACTNTFDGRCGGSGWIGSTCCPVGSACVAQSEWYSSCVVGAQSDVPWSASSSAPPSSSSTSTKTSSVAPSTSQAPTTSSTTSSAAPTQSAPTCSLVAAYGQCGGSGYTGCESCTSGYYCLKSNDWYSQCVPGSAPATSSSTTTTSSSTTSKTSSSSSVAPPQSTCTNPLPAWAQCAGLGFVIPSGYSNCCQSGYTCTFSSTSYSQCLAGSSSGGTTSSSTTSSSTTSKATSSSTTSSAAPAPTTPVVPSCSGSAGAWGQCGGLAWLGATCCPSGYSCIATNAFYSQCQPVTASSTTTTTTTTKATSTTTSTAPAATKTCTAGSNSDSCTPYSVLPGGVQLPSGTTFQANGHVNYQAVPCSQYDPSKNQSYLNPGSNWTPQSFGMHFDPNNNQPGGAYIGKSLFDWGQAAAAMPGGFCITWVQIDFYNQHYGEGGQKPICNAVCGK